MPAGRKIGILEDDGKLCSELRIFLENNGYQAEGLKPEDYTVEGILKGEYALVLLDIGLPGTDGLYLCRELRRVSELPVIIITSRDSQMTELISMNQGADDFVTKPFHPQILLARIEAVLKRVYREPAGAVKRLGAFTLDTARGMVTAGEESAELTRNELRILSCLGEHRNRIVTREELMSYLWDSELFVDDNTLTVNMTRLRARLDSIGVHEVIQTKRGLGYMLVCDTDVI